MTDFDTIIKLFENARLAFSIEFYDEDGEFSPSIILKADEEYEFPVIFRFSENKSLNDIKRRKSHELGND